MELRNFRRRRSRWSLDSSTQSRRRGVPHRQPHRSAVPGGARPRLGAEREDHTRHGHQGRAEQRNSEQAHGERRRDVWLEPGLSAASTALEVLRSIGRLDALMTPAARKLHGMSLRLHRLDVNGTRQISIYVTLTGESRGDMRRAPPSVACCGGARAPDRR